MNDPTYWLPSLGGFVEVVDAADYIAERNRLLRLLGEAHGRATYLSGGEAVRDEIEAELTARGEDA